MFGVKFWSFDVSLVSLSRAMETLIQVRDEWEGQMKRAAGVTGIVESPTDIGWKERTVHALMACALILQTTFWRLPMS